MTTTSTEPHAGASSGQPDQSGLDLDALRGLVGRSSPFNSARDPVNESMIRHWCDILGEHNPVYTDAAAAAALGVRGDRRAARDARRLGQAGPAHDAATPTTRRARP